MFIVQFFSFQQFQFLLFNKQVLVIVQFYTETNFTLTSFCIFHPHFTLYFFSSIMPGTEAGPLLEPLEHDKCLFFYWLSGHKVHTLSLAPPVPKDWNPASCLLHRAIQMGIPLYCWVLCDSLGQGSAVGMWPWGEAINEQQFGEHLLYREDEYFHGQSNAFVCPSPGSCDMKKADHQKIPQKKIIRTY